MGHPIEQLMDEHRVIERVLDTLTSAGQHDVPTGFYEKAIDFIVRFTDECHHGKEEDRLFPLLAKKGIPHEGGPIGCMLHEHDIGRTHVRNMKQYLAVGDIPSLRNESLQYVDLLRQHILKEDSVLFPMGLGTLSHEELTLM